MPPSRTRYPVVLEQDYPFICFCDDAGLCAVDESIEKCLRRPAAAFGVVRPRRPPRAGEQGTALRRYRSSRCCSWPAS